MIEARNVAKHYGYKAVLRGVDLRVDTGEFVALVGPNGAGKTTLLRIMASLGRATAGSVRIAGQPLSKGAGRVRRLLGVVTHQSMLYGDLTAEQNMRFYARLYSLKDADERIEEVLRLVGLTAARNEMVRSFSRGMQQRLAIGRAVLHRPLVLLLDEPHTGLDQQAAGMLDELLGQVAAEGRSVLMSSHDLARAHALAKRVDVLARGVIAASVRTSEVSASGLMKTYREAAHA